MKAYKFYQLVSQPLVEKITIYVLSYLLRVVGLVGLEQQHQRVREGQVHLDVELLDEDLEVAELLDVAVLQQSLDHTQLGERFHHCTNTCVCQKTF